MANKTILLVSSVFILPVTWVLFRLIPEIIPGNQQFMAAMGLYWLVLLLAIYLTTKDRTSDLILLLNASPASSSIILRMLPFLPAIGVLFISFLPNFTRITLEQFITILGISMINGYLEEIYWRGLYLKEFPDNFWIGLFFSSFLFGSWHISLWTLKGVAYQGGFASLVGGAFIMGILWSFVSRRMKSIRLCIAAHVLVNVLAFTELFVRNGS